MATLDDILSKLHKPTEADKELVSKAYKLAEKAHEGHTRYSGDPYMSHVASVALRLAEMGMGPRTIAAGLLHDTIEDTEVTAEQIKEEFGDEILFLVEGVTKLSSVRYYGSDRHNESLRKLFVATSQDIRVLIIKLIDRLHNMETLEYVPPEKQERIAQETLEIYAPVAHRLGMGLLRKELEDYAFKYVYPEEYEKVCSISETQLRRSNVLFEKDRKTLQKRLAASGLREFQTSHRIKGLYSLYHKLQRKDWDIEKIYDLLAVRVVVNTVEECYQVLGIIHEIWRPLPKRVKDYIAFPKPNGYQSIHTTVATSSGAIIEVQIRTTQMHHEAEYGVASHIIYKDKTENTGNGKSSWFASLIPTLFRPFSWRQKIQDEEEVTKDTPHKEKIPKWIGNIGEMYRSGVVSDGFINDMRDDFFTHRIFIFTPHGDVVDLPLGATPIDFAFAIHSEVGAHTAGAKVNGKQVSLDSELKNGDIVEITTRKGAKPSRKWLDHTKTTLARRHIKSMINSEDEVSASHKK